MHAGRKGAGASEAETRRRHPRGGTWQPMSREETEMASPQDGEQHAASLGTRRTHDGPTEPVTYYSLAALQERGVDLSRLPFTIKVLLENLLRHADGEAITDEDVLALARW